MRVVVVFWDGDVREYVLCGEYFRHVLNSGWFIKRDDFRIRSVKSL